MVIWPLFQRFVWYVQSHHSESACIDYRLGEPSRFQSTVSASQEACGWRHGLVRWGKMPRISAKGPLGIFRNIYVDDPAKRKVHEKLLILAFRTQTPLQ